MRALRHDIMGVQHREVRIPVGGIELAGELVIPRTRGEPRGTVVFAHGSGSSRFSPRNVEVADRLQESALATLLLDLLTEGEERIDRATRRLRFDVEMLASRLEAAVRWIRREPGTADLPVGFFGASTGAAAALRAAAHLPEVRAIVSRGGRPDLAGHALAQVSAATLLIVGELDSVVLELNQRSFELLQGKKDLVVVPRATHLFEEPGALEDVARLARDWFVENL